MKVVIKRLNLIACVLVFAVVCPILISATALPKKILIFSGDNRYLPGVILYDQGVQSTLKAESTEQFQFFSETLEVSRISTINYETEMVDLLRKKYEREKIDLIFAYTTPALEFLLKHEDQLFSNVPKIFVILDHRDVSKMTLGANAAGVAGNIEFAPTVDMMLAQNPATERIVVVSGSSNADKNYLAQAKNEFTRFAGRVEFVYLTDRSIQEFQNELSVLPPKTLVFYLSVLADTTGTGFSGPQSLSLLAPFISAPTYGVSQTIHGLGIVGGHLISHEEIGKRAAKIGLRVLAGERPRDIPPETVSNVMMFDWRQLQKWGIDDSRLPYGSVVDFRTPSAWEQYRAYLVAGLAILIFQTILIVGLVLAQSRRKKAELERNEFRELAADKHLRLEEVVSNVPGIVWESRTVSETGRRRAVFVSGYVEEMLGYSVEECMTDSEFIGSRILEEDREEYQREADLVFRTGDPKTVQFRCITKEGGWIWAESHVTAVRDAAGNPIGLRGVTMDITDRKLAEAGLVAKEQQLTEAQRLAQVGNWEWKGATGEVTWSEEIYRIYGLVPTEPPVSFEEHGRLYTPESWARLQSAVADTLETGKPYEVELEVIHTDGRHLWTSARGEVQGKNDDLMLRGTLQDITERKLAEEALSDSEERYRNVVETQTELICRYLPDTTLTFVNDVYCRYFQKTREELIGTKFVDLIPPHARSIALGHIASLVENPRSETYEHEVVLPNGTRGWQQWTDRRVETLNGDPVEIQGVGRDITEKREIEEALRISESRFRIMADSAPVLIWMSGPDKLCTYVNQGWLRFTGRTNDTELGNGWTAGIHPEDLDRTSEIMNSAFDRREPFRFEYRLRRADGAFRWVYNSGTPRFSSDGEFLGYIGSCVDISDRKEAEEELKKAHDEVVRLQQQLQEENLYLKEVIKLEHNFDELIGHSDALKYVLFKIEQVAPTDTTVLITGETGTGKELVAHAIHSMSLRKNRPLVKVNCAALSATLIESELFGHERGAFTGANSRKIGRFELADGATIFLDEIGELPLELQPKLLRLIQEGEFERLGSSTTLKADVRIMAATNRILEAEVRAGRFREDLLFRLNVFPITVPPLRDRKEDIPALAEHFTEKLARKLGKTIDSISPQTIRTLGQYGWPGNIRELANAIERAVIGTNGSTLRMVETLEAKQAAPDVGETIQSLESVEKAHIIKTLLNTGWRIEGPNGAARILGLNPSTLRTRMNKLGIEKSNSPAV